jgi:hypothetical protein
MSSEEAIEVLVDNVAMDDDELYDDSDHSCSSGDDTQDTEMQQQQPSVEQSRFAFCVIL